MWWARQPGYGAADPKSRGEPQRDGWLRILGIAPDPTTPQEQRQPIGSEES